MKIKYFFVTDKLKDKELNILYCPTKKMIEDSYTKILQCVLFKDHWNAILGNKENAMPLNLEQYVKYTKSKSIDSPCIKHHSRQECVGI